MSETHTPDATWYEATQVAAPERPQLTFDVDVDVCVVGAGLAGLTVAREVARRGWSVAVLEANRVAWAASGRNTGFVLPGFQEDHERMIERIGLDQTKELWALSEQGLAYVRRAIDEIGMPGVEPVPGWLTVSKTDESGRESRTEVERLRWIGAEVEAWSTERVREVLPNRRYFSAVHFPTAFHIHPLNYALGLAAAAEAAGARIFQHTPAISIDPAGVRKRILTPSALVRAGQVVLAGNTHIAALMPELAGTLLPLTSHVAVTEPLGPKLAEAITYQGAISDTRSANFHYRIVDGDRLMWAGGGEPFARSTGRVAESFKAAIMRTYPQLDGVEIASSWSGVMGFTMHRMPQIGEVSPGLWIASGFGGHGLNTSAIAGNLVARAIADSDDHWRAFVPFELCWAGGGLGRVFAEASSLVRNWREDFDAKQAQKRERQRREAGDALPPPDWNEARAAAAPAAADAYADEPHDLRSSDTWPYERQPRGELTPDDEVEAADGPSSAAEIDWRQAQRSAEPNDDRRR